MNKDITLEDLDYLISFEDDTELTYNQNLEYTDSYYRYISFDKVNKVIEIDDNSTEPFYLQTEELQAIYNKCKELGWLDE